ncbi:hypothetical protein LLG95_13470 [bacterium]|nr:hypothetical protein [bacterium]
MPWSKPGNAPAVFLNNRFYILSGDDGIWSSSDAVKWDCVLQEPIWAPRKDFAAAVFNGRIYVMGGRYAYVFYNDVWSSSDGIDWTRESTSAGWLPRSLSGAIVFKNRLWLIGGVKTTSGTTTAEYTYYNDVWSTANGSDWEAGPAVPWTARAMPGLAVFNNQLYMTGGAGVSDLHDVWVSDNGTDWTQKTASAPWGEEWSLSAATTGGKLWAFGGATRKTWNSTNGTDWTEAAAAPWPSTWGQSGVTAGTNFYIFAGGELTTGTTTLASKIWRTANGSAWTQLGGDKELWNPRSLYRTLEYKGNLWLVGGISSANSTTSESAEAWRANLVPSPYGYNITGWIPVSRNAPWHGRWAHGLLNYNNKMWILGGCDDAHSYGDVWSSTNGSSWTLVTNNAWPRRAYHAAAVYDNKMWVICGTGRPDLQTENSDVYWSTDGLNWTRTTDTAPFAARRGMAAVAFGGKLWVIGGCYGTNLTSYPQEAWSTTNGIAWTRESDALPLARRDFGTAVIDGKIWMLGGMTPMGLSNDVWTSADGVHWDQAEAAPWSARSGLSAIYFNNAKLLVLGGNAHENLNDAWALQFRTGAENAWMRVQ